MAPVIMDHTDAAGNAWSVLTTKAIAISKKLFALGMYPAVLVMIAARAENLSGDGK